MEVVEILCSDARNVMAPASGFGRPRGLSIQDSGYFVSLDAGKYEVASAHYFMA